MPSDVLPETLVVGGGIGGLSAALCLARRGGTVTLVERSKSFAEVGAGIQLAPNATRILDRLGVLEKIEPVAVRPRRLVLADAIEGRELTSLELTDFPSRYGAPYLVLHRNDLLSALLEGCEGSGVKLHTDAHVTALDDTGDGVVAATADGREFRAGIAIGADGLHSRIRKLFADDEPVNSGFVAYRGAVPMEQVERHADLRDVVAWLGPGLHLVQYPLRSGRMYNQVAVFRSQAYRRGDPDYGNPQELREAFAGCSEHVRESLGTLSIDNRWPMLDRPPIAGWAHGRLALLGDAAHPMLQYLAQGACQALEDADALADELAAAARAGLPPAEGLTRYAARRAPRAMRVQRTARTWGEIWHVDGVAKLIRDELLLDRDVADHKHVAWLYDEAPLEKERVMTDVIDEAALARLYADFAAADLKPLWTEIGNLQPEFPQPDALPYRWAWADLLPLAERAGDLVPVGRGGERRAIALANPGLGGQPFATPTLWAAIQYLGAGEVAPSHRHAQGAFRFVVRGEAVWTVVNGDPVQMRAGDLLLTPSWHWHGHHHVGDEPMAWLDGLDIPLVKKIDASFFEFGDDGIEDKSTPDKSRSERLWAHSGRRPLSALEDRPNSPLMAYRWADTDAALAAQLELEDEGYPGVYEPGHAAIRFTNPMTGGDALPTLRTEFHRLRAGTTTSTQRSTGSSVWQVFRGHGTAELAGNRFVLAEGDLITVPSWAPLRFVADTQLDLFTFNDHRLFEVLNLYRKRVINQRSPSRPVPS